MPKSYVTKAVAEVQHRLGVYGPVSPDSTNGKALVSAGVSGFAVSRDAAAVRLKVLGFLGAEPAIRSLFS
jgi:hypothetical protein